MAGNFNGKPGHGSPSLSTSMYTFWNTDLYQVGNGDFQSVKLGVYGDKLTLNFNKGNTAQGSKSQSAFLSMDWESACIVWRTLKYIEQTRKECLRNNVEYPVWSFKNTLQFTDKESKTLRTLGVFEIRTEISQVTQKNTVYISYTAGPDRFEVALGSMYLKDQCEFSDNRADIDTNDSRFYAFTDMFTSIIIGWAMMQQQQKTFGVIMNNFSAIRMKMGIPAKTPGNNKGGNYTDSNYNSTGDSAADAGDFDGPAPDLSDLGSGEPF